VRRVGFIALMVLTFPLSLIFLLRRRSARPGRRSSPIKPVVIPEIPPALETVAVDDREGELVEQK
jgi:hypothetical protein